MEELSNLKLPELKKECKSRGLSSTGNKAELVARLQSAMATSKSPISEDSVIDDALLDDDSVLDDDSSGAGSSNEDSNLVDLISETTPPPSVSGDLSPVKKPAEAIKRVATVSPTKVVVPLTGMSEDGSPPKKKKITLNRQPLPTAAVIEKSVTQEAEKKIIKISATVSAEDKAKLRQQKFGVALEDNTATTTKTKSPISSNPFIDNRLKKRADRFSSAASSSPVQPTVTGVVSLTSEDDLKLAKRKERFGATAGNAPDKKDKRAARFGGGTTTTSISTPSVGIPTSSSAEDKKKLRAARFKAAP